jgi:hypothetical protein
VLVQQAVDTAAIGGRGSHHPEHDADFLERHVEVAALADKLQPIEMPCFVAVEVARRACGPRQQPLPLPVADGLDCNRRGCGQSPIPVPRASGNGWRSPVPGWE